MIFFLMILVILVIVVLWNYDLHKILYVKSITQNGGDSAALVAARWQGITLNLIGDLNIMHALAIQPDGTDADIAPSISNTQARLCFVGPMIAYMAAQQAAKNNHIFQNDRYSQRTLQHATAVRVDYPRASGPTGDPLFPEPYPGCWSEYADMLQLIGNEGVAAGPDNASLYTDYAGGAVLLQIDFYDAIAGRTWCWFYNEAPTLLEDYQNFFPCWWPPLPDIPHIQYINSEIFGLGLVKVETALSGLTANPGDMAGQITTLGSDRGLGAPAASNFMDTVSTWYCYSPGAWSTWDAMATDGPDPFPATGRVKPQYDYTGADAAIRIEATASRVTPGHRGAEISDTITWTAAAKPFGYLNEADQPNSCGGLVLPAFREVALIPVDASSAPSGGGYNIPWRDHIEQHLPLYMENGPTESSCYYCRQLMTWENEEFRQVGVVWLSSNSYQCVASGGPGRYRGGGTRRGH